ncbi:MAG: hypothetical protein IKU52_08750 [Clostridia bacterium]|nr:hypothetical protein [Clostridia bacterium]
MKKILAFVLCLLMLIPLLCACGGKSGEGKAVSALPEASHVVEGTTYEGEEFKILCREDNAYGTYLYEIVADEGETELVNQAVYERNRNVKDIFGLSDIIANDIPGDWANGGDFVNTFRNSIDAGIGDFDLIMGYCAYMASGELAQYFYNYYDVPVVKETLACEDESHDHDYFYQDCIDEISVNGQLKYMVGDYSLTYWDRVYVMFFNKKLAQDYQLEDIYQLVRDGKWTIDECIEMSRGKWTDQNNDQWPDESDVFGYITDIPNTMDNWHSHFDVQPTKHDEEGNIKIEFDVGKVTNILTKMIEFKNTDDCYTAYMTSGDTVDENPLDKIFREGRALFYPTSLQRAQMFRSMEVDFGIIPCPKWDVNQESYYTSADISYSVACIPADAPNLEKAGGVFDTLTAISSEKVIPAYYDQALTFKYTRDEESAEMLDIIRNGFTINFGMFYTDTIDCCGVFRNLMANDNSNFASYYAANKPGYERKLKQLLEYYE